MMFVVSWLDKLSKGLIARLPPQPFAPPVTFDFEHVRRAIELVEAAIERNKTQTTEASRAAAMKAAMDPSHSFIEKPVFAPMAAAFWEAEMTFPLILRRSILIAISAHTEHALRCWCRWLEAEWLLPRGLDSLSPQGRESVLHRGVRYLRDEAKIALDDFEDWPEWQRVDAYRIARNCLAHDGGAVEDPEHRAKIEALPQIQVDESRLLIDRPVVHVLPGGCEAAAEAADAFLQRLATVCQDDPRAKR